MSSVNRGHNFKDLTGKRFDKLIALDNYYDPKIGKTIWRCKCDCGNITHVRSSVLLGGDTKSCNCLRKEKSGKRKFVGDISGNFWCVVKRGAIKRNLDLVITQEEAWNLFLKQNKKCTLSGLELYFQKKVGSTASLDRIDSNKGYTIDNVFWTHKKINMMRLDYSLDEFLYFCDLVTNPLTDIKPIYNLFDTSSLLKSKFIGNISSCYWCTLQHNAKRRKINFDISMSDIWSQYIKQNGRCAYTGLPIFFWEEWKYRNNQTASLDRIDSSLGYYKENVWWVHKIINTMKMKLSHHEFINLCNLVTKYRREVKYAA